jgi:tripartite-type tricarboxylate transporter receptor subunit TctC
MKFPRRRFLRLAAGAAVLPAVSRFAMAQTYPSRPVRIIVGQAAGSPPDIIARLIGQILSERLGQQFIVENRPGAGQNIGAEAAIRSPPDGYTLLLATAANVINATLYDNLNFNFIRDTAPVAGALRTPNIMVVNPSLPARTIPEFIAYAKANPGKLNIGTGGKGTTTHLGGELFKIMAGVDLVLVPYRGSTPAVTDLLGGQVQVMFDVLSSAIEHIKTGRLRALAVTGATRSAVLPDVPAVSEFLPGFEVSGWSGVVAPAKTPAEIIDRLNKEVNAGLADPKIAARLANLGAGMMGAMTPAEFGKFMIDQTEKWAAVIRAANIKPG